jgi:hypothetical protein
VGGPRQAVGPRPRRAATAPAAVPPPRRPGRPAPAAPAGRPGGRATPAGDRPRLPERPDRRGPAGRAGLRILVAAAATRPHGHGNPAAPGGQTPPPAQAARNSHPGNRRGYAHRPGRSSTGRGPHSNNPIGPIPRRRRGRPGGVTGSRPGPAHTPGAGRGGRPGDRPAVGRRPGTEPGDDPRRARGGGRGHRGPAGLQRPGRRQLSPAGPGRRLSSPRSPAGLVGGHGGRRPGGSGARRRGVTAGPVGRRRSPGRPGAPAVGRPCPAVGPRLGSASPPRSRHRRWRRCWLGRRLPV